MSQLSLKVPRVLLRKLHRDPQRPKVSDSALITSFKHIICFIFVLICLIYYDYHDPYNYLTSDDYFRIYEFLVNLNVDIIYWA